MFQKQALSLFIISSSNVNEWLTGEVESSRQLRIEFLKNLLVQSVCIRRSCDQKASVSFFFLNMTNATTTS